MYFTAETTDELMRIGSEALFKEGVSITPTKGAALELSGVTFHLTNPLARVSFSSSRGKIFSALGELCWYLSGSKSGIHMDYYLSKYSAESADFPKSRNKDVNGAYGPRIFSQNKPSQFEIVESILSRKPDTRQAVVQIFDASDIRTFHRDVPCTCLLQFLIRRNKLDLIVYMRSNDLYKGFPHDLFSFTMIQEIMCRKLRVDLGEYKHIVGSFHLYNADQGKIRSYLDEGYQSNENSMPEMPDADINNNLETLILAERELRELGETQINLDSIDSYWSDLIKLLQAYRYKKDNNRVAFDSVSRIVSCPYYHPFFSID